MTNAKMYDKIIGIKSKGRCRIMEDNISNIIEKVVNKKFCYERSSGAIIYQDLKIIKLKDKYYNMQGEMIKKPVIHQMYASIIIVYKKNTKGCKVLLEQKQSGKWGFYQRKKDTLDDFLKTAIKGIMEHGIIPKKEANLKEVGFMEIFINQTNCFFKIHKFNEKDNSSGEKITENEKRRFFTIAEVKELCKEKHMLEHHEKVIQDFGILKGRL